MFFNKKIRIEVLEKTLNSFQVKVQKIKKSKDILIRKHSGHFQSKEGILNYLVGQYLFRQNGDVEVFITDLTGSRKTWTEAEEELMLVHLTR